MSPAWISAMAPPKGRWTPSGWFSGWQRQQFSWTSLPECWDFWGWLSLTVGLVWQGVGTTDCSQLAEKDWKLFPVWASHTDNTLKPGCKGRQEGLHQRGFMNEQSPCEMNPLCSIKGRHANITYQGSYASQPKAFEDFPSAH